MSIPHHIPHQYSSIETLYQDYQRPILAYLTRLVNDRETAEDLCQETFVKAIRHWAEHNPESSAVAWLYRIATNTAYDYLRGDDDASAFFRSWRAIRSQMIADQWRHAWMRMSQCIWRWNKSHRSTVFR